MSLNVSQENSASINRTFDEVMVVPEFTNLIFLLLAVLGMYQGIEIGHPLYAVLFANLIVPMAFSVMNIIGFAFMPQISYVIFANTNNAMSIFFHCTCWCITSLIRYLYIIKPDWLHKKMPSIKVQCFSVLALTITFACFLTFPMIGYGLHIGN